MEEGSVARQWIGEAVAGGEMKRRKGEDKMENGDGYEKRREKNIYYGKEEKKVEKKE